MKLLIFLIIVLTILIILIGNNYYSNFTTDNISNIYIVSFAHNCCKKAQENLEKTAYEHGAYKAISLNLDTLEAPVKVKEYIKNNKRLAGYAIWKPYAIKQILKLSEPDDIIIYADSGTFFNKNLYNISEFIKKNNILCFKHGGNDGDTRQFKWTKMNAVKYFGYSTDLWCSEEGQKDQFYSGFVGIINNDIGNFFIDKWKKTMSPNNSYLFDDSPSNIKNCEKFKESRHDQQMLSLILYKYFPDILFPDYNKNKYGWVCHEKINGNGRHD